MLSDGRGGVLYSAGEDTRKMALGSLSVRDKKIDGKTWATEVVN